MCISYKSYSTKTGLRPESLEESWGETRLFTHNTLSSVKIANIKPGEETSYGNQSEMAGLWRILQGDGMVTIGEKEYRVKEDYEIRIPKGINYKIKAGPSGVKILEISAEE